MSTETMLEYIVRLMIIFLISPIHEFAHAWSAHLLGDDTAKYSGRLTLSPFAHVDIWGALLIFFFGFGWAKPVPVNPLRFKKPRLGMLITAAAGPLSNIVVALLGMAVLQIMSTALMLSGTTYYIYLMVYFFVIININMAVFNLLPIPPLDGSRILSYFTPYKVDRWINEHYTMFFIILVLLMSTPILGKPLSLLSELIFNLLEFITSWIPLLLR
ncbi:MAG: site-2 protease family protein [Oscillospiraceae bacterium]|nr:site-2 protease family protein [Oscillospiraceae bacterium]MBQ9111592.1 site-2 protease family protein [Oscillospiraceae bacterium]